MMWIVTLALLFVAAWLYFNALNERRWVEAHRHDETVASDTGLLPNFSAMTGTGSPESGRLSIEQESGRFARAVQKVQAKTAGLGERIEKRVEAARVDDAQRPTSAADEPGRFGRLVARVSERTGRFDDRLSERMQAEGEKARNGASITEEDTLFGRLAKRLAPDEEAVSKRDRRVERERAEARARARFDGGPGDSGSADDTRDDGFFDRLVGRVQGGMARLEDSVDAKLESSRRADDAQRGLEADDDLLSRVSARVGQRVNEIDEKIVSASVETSRKVEEKFGASPRDRQSGDGKSNET